MKLLVALWALFPLAFAASSNVPEIESGYEYVTCGSTIKLTSQSTNYKLHSHGVSYGTGSQQQSVTGFSEKDDSNSFWIVQAGFGKHCKRGAIIPCGSTIRLRHANTKGYLHSHHHKSPLSSQQEVSCFDGQDTGDDWKVDCVQRSKHWRREEPVQLKHVDSHNYLSCSTSHQYGQPIPGQLEVAAARSASKNTQWVTQEGIYFAAIDAPAK
ncbi:Stromal cell-derived factor 2-like protein 1 [Apophysomyces sp. BC1034]|nr:Stromal cell-derived factor 2-like protein 1 [Apophysomyces sp. BC1015]KAG0178862.1 Stromal cell-derived factor 2-like protein 1 [Apophysomyces sp. BC1021]KAG0189194.1 Stromal cell-derived factor 2-like protein 1 [Apophysomyces sp. BC1034]